MMDAHEPRAKSKIGLLFILLFVLLLAAAAAAAEFLQKRDALAFQQTGIDIAEKQIAPATSAWEDGRAGSGSSIEETSQTEAGEDTFITPEGFPIISLSKKWKGTRLRDIYHEMLNNAHGAELKYINAVVVYPKSNGSDADIMGTQSDQKTTYELSLELPAFIPDTVKYMLSSTTSNIVLYNMDDYGTVTEAARTIAHEYGHHFTRYYMFEDEDNYAGSEYYKLRGLEEYPKAKIYKKEADYRKNYEWDVLELAAEDYVQLLGSKNAKKTKTYKDIDQWLHSGAKTYKLDVDYSYYNVYPQRNIFVPSALQVKGLDAYYHSFLEDGYKPGQEYPNIKISFKKHSKNGHTYYDVTWNALPDAKGAIYTLLCYDKDGSLVMPVKTVKSGGKMSAVIGTPSYKSGSYIYYWTDNIPKKTRIFKVTALLKDGTVVSSKPQTKSF